MIKHLAYKPKGYYVVKPYLRPLLLSVFCALITPLPSLAATGSLAQGSLAQEVQQWKKQGQKANPALLTKIREQFNLKPRDPQIRQALKDFYASQTGGSLQEKELNTYRLLNLDPQNVGYRNSLSRLLYQKHGGVSQAQVKAAYRHLNDAFNAWDEGKTDVALQLFQKARLDQSAELNAILAYHLRDAGKIEEAKAILSRFKGDKSYLNAFTDIQKQINQAEQVIASRLPESEKLLARLHLGQYDAVTTALNTLEPSSQKSWLEAKFHEKRGEYHPASRAYLDYYQRKHLDKMPGYTPVVYKAQLEDVNSLDLIALKFRTSPALIRQVNQLQQQEWVDTYRMLIVPVKPHQLHFPTTGYVSSHFGYRLHPIRGTWRLHEGVDIETLPGVDAEASHGGKVIQSVFDKACGNMVKLSHADLGINTAYCHGEKLKVKTGQEVQQGQSVIETGNTGASASNHLHFGVQQKGTYIDPMDWL